LTYGSALTAGFLSGMVFNVSGTASTVTGLALTNVPTTANRAYTFTFIMNTTNSNYYISTGTISVNGTSVTLGGTINSSTPSYYIIQQINLFNVGGTFNTAVTTASFF
jgi:riboflavin synthase alpha subunit